MFRYMTAGESHGKGMMAILEGVPAGLKIDEKCINNELIRRMHGYGRGGRMKIEKDQIEIISGCRKGMTIGSPMGLVVINKDHKIDTLPEVKSPRPGHADLAGMQKYGFGDARDVLERASARESVAKVAAGSVAKLFLKEFCIRVTSHVTAIGDVKAQTDGLSFDEIEKFSDISRAKLRCADKEAEKKMCNLVDEAAKEGDTLGGVFEVIVDNVLPGMGSYVQWDSRLDGRLARAIMSIPAVKGISIGNGIECAYLKGSETHDPIVYEEKEKRLFRETNNAGGIEGGMSNGEAIRIRGFMKPIATLKKPLKSVNIDTKEASRAATERSDVTAVPACGVIAEAVVAIEIASVLTEKFGSDSIEEIKRNYNGYIEQLKNM
ncbi:MAG: chorismate synthase [Candidatus Aadella gelida]|nr:chorismate synthase [Candidatus Aadella gelida]